MSGICLSRVMNVVEGNRLQCQHSVACRKVGVQEYLGTNPVRGYMYQKEHRNHRIGE